jgi:DNA-binding MarR family transcriptional regulator
MSQSPTAAATVAPSKPLPRGCTNFLLHQLVRRMDRLYDAELAKAGLKTTQYSLLSHVVRLGPVSPGALAQAMKMQPSTLTRNLRPLVLAGWAEIGVGDDARSRSVTATGDGRAKHLQGQRHWKMVQQRVNRLLGDDNVVSLHRQLAQVMDAVAADAINEKA